MPRSLLGWSSNTIPVVPVALQSEHGELLARAQAGAGGNHWRVTLEQPVTKEVSEKGRGAEEISCSKKEQPPKTDIFDIRFPQADDGAVKSSDSSGQMRSVVEIDGARFTVNHVYYRSADGCDQLLLSYGADCWQFSRSGAAGAHTDTAGSGKITAPMPGRVAELAVTQGQVVEAGQQLAVLEAMKMQHRITADVAGTVTDIHVSADSQVRSGELLLELDTQS